MDLCRLAIIAPQQAYVPFFASYPLQIESMHLRLLPFDIFLLVSEAVWFAH